MRQPGDYSDSGGLVYDFIGADEVWGHFQAPDHAGRPAVPVSVFAWIAERVTWAGTALQLASSGLAGRCLSSNTRLLLPVSGGGVRVHARRSGQAPSSMLWHIDYRDEQNRVCARSSVLIAVDTTLGA